MARAWTSRYARCRYAGVAICEIVTGRVYGEPIWRLIWPGDVSYAQTRVKYARRYVRSMLEVLLRRRHGAVMYVAVTLMTVTSQY